MVQLPDGVILDMQWKQVLYFNHGEKMAFQIIPMCNKKDIILILNKDLQKVRKEKSMYQLIRL